MGLVIAKPSSYRAEIDGLRAIAVIAVIVNHINASFLPGGYLGVDIFFVISGYVITASLCRHRFESFADFIGKFYLRRLKRLLPALVLFVGILSILICLVNPNPGLSLQTGLASLIGISNLILYNLKTDYFAGSTELNVFTHTWSLGVEEQFYLLFPFIFWFSGFGSRGKGSLNRFAVIMAALTTASLLIFVWLKIKSPEAAFFLMPPRLWEMGLGCLLFVSEQSRIVGPVPSLIAWPALAAMVVCLWLPPKLSLFSTVGVALSSTLLVASLVSNRTAARLFSSSALVGVGVISYSLYLWHWGVLSLSRWTIGIHWWTIPFQLLLMIGLAYSSYRWVEKPLRAAAWSAQPLYSFLYGAFGVGTTAALIGILAAPMRDKLFLGQKNELQKQSYLKDQLSIELCNLFEDPGAVGSEPGSCGFRPGREKRVVYLVGDSHIHQFRHAIATYASQHGLGLHGVWGNACPFPDLPSLALSSDARTKFCQQQQKALANKLQSSVKRGDIVFIGDYLTAYFVPAKAGPAYKEALQDYSFRLRKISEDFIARGATVILYVNAPRFDGLEGMSEGFCFPQWYKPALSPNCMVDAKLFLERRDRNFGWIKNSWADGNRRLVWDGVDATTCGPKICTASHYKDEAHFQDYYSSYIFRRFIALHPGLATSPMPGPPDTTATGSF
jgi:peptidoglycan/LPS O-acetylase OafA/YrhL